MARIPRSKVDARVRDMYDVFGPLHKRRSQLAGTLSGGEQQMLAIARGLIMKPRVLMIDEMSQGLAPTIVQELFEIVRSLPEQGVAVLIVEQFVTHALAVASRAYVLEKGEVAYSGEAAALARDEAFVKGSYLGDAGDGEVAEQRRRRTSPRAAMGRWGFPQTCCGRSRRERRRKAAIPPTSCSSCSRKRSGTAREVRREEAQVDRRSQSVRWR